MIKLTITEKGGEPKALSFDKDEISIGRVSGNDIVLPKGNVSKRHSRIAKSDEGDGRIEVSDLKSTNGTYVNGRKIADPLFVTSADKIYVGDFMIVVDAAPPAASAGNGLGESVASGARKMPMPPPPPPARGSSALSALPADDAGDDEEDLALAVRPPGAGRMPPPPPPARRTPLGNPEGLGDLEEEPFAADGTGALTNSSTPYDGDGDDEIDEDGTGGGPALFSRSGARPRAADLDDEDAFKESPVTANRPPGDLLAAMVAPEPAPSRPTAAPLARPVEPGSAPTFDRGTSKVVAASAVTGDEARSLEALDVLMADAAVTAIFILGPETTLVERAGKIEPHPTSLGDPNSVADALWRIATSAVPPPPPDNPVIDVRLLDGTRVAAVFPPAAPAGLCAAIRKATLPAGRTFANLGPSGTMSGEVQVLLEAAIAGQRNLLVTGDSGAVGAVLAVVADAVAAERRVVSIGAGAARGRAGWTELAPGGDMAALIRVAAAFRAEHLLVGELAGAEAGVGELLAAAARGQEGIVFGLPARSAAEALARLEALSSRGTGGGAGGSSGVARLVDSTIDLVVHAVSLAEGGVLIVEIAEPKLDAGDKLGGDPVVAWQPESAGAKRGSAGKPRVTGVSARLGAALAASGHSLPSNLLRDK